MNILQINSTINSGSHGRMANDIGQILIRKGHKSYIAYGRASNTSESHSLKIGKKLEIYSHVLVSRLFDRHGFGSANATGELVESMEIIKPDIVHLHNIHGYYLNVRILFNYLKDKHIPVIWTLHDCWPFTGHCSHFQRVGCERWKTGCHDCPLIHRYPTSWFIDNSRKNYMEKKELFNGLDKMIIVSPSNWLFGHLKNSFLSNYDLRVINNGINLSTFKPVDPGPVTIKYNLSGRYIIGVANVWSYTKGLDDFVSLRAILDPEISIVLVGLSVSRAKELPKGMIGIARTENTEDLTALYSGAMAFVNPTYVDNFPSVNIEALACGTPVITYMTGGSPEAVDQHTGIVVEKGNIVELKKAIAEISSSTDNYTSDQCRTRALRFFSAEERLRDYIDIYDEVLVH